MIRINTRFRWFMISLRVFYYRLRYGIDATGFDGSMLPMTGKGKFVSVYVKGSIIQIIDENGISDEIRIVPYQPNHGVKIETIRNNKCITRNILDIRQLNKNAIFVSNVEQLVEQAKYPRQVDIKSNMLFSK